MCSILVQGHYLDQSFELIYESQDGYDVLLQQCSTACLEEFSCNPILVDAFGRSITNDEDVEDTRRVMIKEIASENSLDQLCSERLSHASSTSDDMSWEQLVETDSRSHHSDSSGLMRATAMLHIWVINPEIIDFENSLCCQDDILLENNEIQLSDVSNNSFIKPKFRIIDTDMSICGHCAKFMDDSLIVSDNSRLCLSTCKGAQLIDMGIAAPPPPIDPEIKEKFAKKCKLTFANQPAVLYLKRVMFQKARSLQGEVMANKDLGESMQSFRRRISSGCETVMVYENQTQQNKARDVIDYDRIREYASQYRDSGDIDDMAFIKGLLNWFKKDFFKWCNKPKCSNPDCTADTSQMNATQTVAPSPEESYNGWAGRTEVYQCKACNNLTRFPRYNDPSKLLETRRGRCGEWANAFCLICRALGLDARWVLDFTDHVWVEVWISSAGRYVHVDPCENKADTPLLYEGGWNKKLSYIFSFSRHGVSDATARYTRQMEAVIERRMELPESSIITLVMEADAAQELQFIQKVSPSNVQNISSRSSLYLDALDSGKDQFEILARQDVSMMVMRRRKRQNRKELAALEFLTVHEWKIDELQGRISGDISWRRIRGEIGNNNNNNNNNISNSSNNTSSNSNSSSVNINDGKPTMLFTFDASSSTSVGGTSEKKGGNK